MIARAENDGQRRIVVGVDGSVPSKAALSWAVEQARLTGAVVEAVIAREYPATYGYPVPVMDVDWEQQASRPPARPSPMSPATPRRPSIRTRS
jgi:nucleotide-binding universal stress UspA family protein